MLSRFFSAALGAALLSLLLPPTLSRADSCWASWYGSGFEGVSTSSGEPYEAGALTTAHRSLPFGTLLRVSYEDRSVTVRVNDRGPWSGGRCLDLSEAAFETLAPLGAGNIPVSFEEVPPPMELSAQSLPPVLTGFDEYLTIYNPAPSPATVRVRYLLSAGAPIEPAPLVVAPTSRATVNVADVVGRGQAVSLQVDSDTPVVAERPMYFNDGQRSGGHVASGQAPATEHYFAEGYTGEGFDTYLVMANPGDRVEGTVAYLVEGGSPVERPFVLSPHSRTTRRESDDLGPGVSAAAIVRTAQPVAVERPMYFRYGPWVDGGHDTPGARAPAPSALFAEGHVGDGFDSYLVILNPGGQPATVSATFTTSAGPVARSWTVPEMSRRTIRLNDELAPGDVALHLQSDQPVVAERSSYFLSDVGQAGLVSGGHVTVGPAAPSTTWLFAEGHTGDQFQEYLVVANPGPSDAVVHVDLASNGGSRWPVDMAVPAGGRGTLDVEAVVGPGHDVAATLASSAPVVAERVVYFRYHGVWDGGHSNLGTTAPATSFIFAEGYTGN